MFFLIFQGAGTRIELGAAYDVLEHLYSILLSALLTQVGQSLTTNMLRKVEAHFQLLKVPLQ